MYVLEIDRKACARVVSTLIERSVLKYPLVFAFYAMAVLGVTLHEWCPSVIEVSEVTA